MVSANISDLFASKVQTDLNPVNELSTKKVLKNKPDSPSFLNLVNTVSKAQTYEPKVQTSSPETKDEPDFTKDNCFTSDLKKEKVVKESSQDIDNESLVEKITDFEEEIEEAIMDAYNITQAQMNLAMANIGIANPIELTDPSKLTDFIMELTGETDPFALVANEDFASIFKTIDMMTDNFLLENDLANENINDLFQSLMNGDFEEVMETVVNEMSIQAEIPEEAVETAPMMEEVQEVNVKPLENKELPQTNEISNEAVSEDETQLIEKVAVNPETDSTNEETGEDESFLNNQETDTKPEEKEISIHTRNEGARGQVNIFSETTVTVDNTPNLQEAPSMIDPENILRQIDEAMKFNQRGLESSIELQLEPESLGKVGVNVTLKNGMVTASIQAQNETVREILESQLVVLKENMNEAGVKVEAVEVTIASHEFEQNLDGNQNNQNANEEESRPSRRNLNLAGLDFMAEDLAEDELLAAQIMRDNGNTVDLTA